MRFESRSKRLLSQTLAPLIPVLAGCFGADAGASAGEAAEFGFGLGVAAADHYALGPEPSLTIGGDDSDPGAIFHQVLSATRLASGVLAVANRGTSEIFLFDSAGRRIGTAGGRGSGPGEFEPHMLLELMPGSGDTIAVSAWTLLRPKIAYFDLGGELLREVIPPQVFEPRGAFLYMTTSRSGYMFTLHGSGTDDSQPTEPTRRPLQLIRLDIADASSDTVGEYLGGEIFYADIGPQPTFGGPPIPGARAIIPLFQASTWLAGGGEPFRVAVGDQAGSRVDVFDESGALVHSVRWKAEGRRPSARDLSLARETYLNHWMNRPDPAAARRALDVMPPIERTPVFQRVNVDRLGRLWVERYPLPTDTLHDWWIFAPDGEPYATAELPGDLRILEIGADYLIALASNDLEIERIEVWPLSQVRGR